MCGRYSFVPSTEQIKTNLADIDLPEQLRISFNIAPTQAAYVLTNHAPKALQQMRWGLVPPWSKEPKPTGKMINARAETIAEKPSFRDAFRARRCIVPADSFYEWRKEGKARRPFRILDKKRQLLFCAGIWERHETPEHTLLTFSIITTTPNAEMKNVHDRMPVFFQKKEERTAWLSKDLNVVDALAMLAPLEDGALDMYEIHQGVGNVRIDNADLHLPVLTLGF